MDNRLGLVFGQRPSHLRKQDLPTVAMAITAYVRGYPVLAGPVTTATVNLMVFRSDAFEVAVLWDDWEKIDPYVRSDYFSPLKYPASAGYNVLDPSVAFNLSTIQADPLYKRVLDVLTLLFPAAYPAAKY